MLVSYTHLGGDEFDELVNNLFKATDSAARNEALKALQDKEQEVVYKVPVFTVGTYVFTSDKVIVPEGVTFCNPLYMCAVSYTHLFTVRVPSIRSRMACSV